MLHGKIQICPVRLASPAVPARCRLPIGHRDSRSMNEHAAAPFPDALRSAIAQALYNCDRSDDAGQPLWDDEGFDARHPGLRDCYLARADALASGPLHLFLT